MNDKRMTVEELVALAKFDKNSFFARAILSLLAEDAPCGWEMPKATLGSVLVPMSWCGPTSPDDARALARLLLVAADEADAKGGGK